MSLDVKNKNNNLLDSIVFSPIPFKTLLSFFLNSEFNFEEVLSDLFVYDTGVAISKLRGLKNELPLGLVFEEKIEDVIREIKKLKD